MIKQDIAIAKHPLFFSSDAKEIKEIKKNSYFVDAFAFQVKELFFIDNTNFVGLPKEEVYKSSEFLKYAKVKENDFDYVYFPWSETLVKCVKKNDYFRLKTNRNQDMITAEEQKKLADYKVAVLGMSVGSNIAIVLAQSGISNELVLADYDELDTTNLNRIIAGVHQVGLNKAVIAARKIYEDNPYAKVRIYDKGINGKNLESLIKRKAVNFIVEEIDNVQLKIMIRKLAFKYKVPVLMITDNGDGIVLHVERYDLGYKKIFGKEMLYWDKRIKEIKSVEDIGKLIVEEIIGGVKYVDERVLASVQRVMKKELVSWSQLGTAAIYGAVVTTVVIKNIVLRGDSRKYVSSVLSPFNN